MKWNKQEKDLLLEKYNKKGLIWCCQELNRSKSSVSLMAKRLSLTHKSYDKHIFDDEFLKENYVKFGAEYCSNKLKRNKNQIIKRACVLKLNPRKTWTKEEEDFLKENYSENGASFCKNTLAVDNFKITLKANRLGLTLTDNASKNIKKETMLELTSKRSYDSFNVNPKQFLKINSPEIAYILGFIWADGYVRKNKNANTIKIDINTKDFNDLKYIFDTTGNWRYYHYTRKEGYKSTTITTNNRPIVDFLINNDYNNKSLLSPNKIIECVPKKLQHYFFRGWSDGDGCFYFSEKNKSFTMVGTYEQSWDSLCNILNLLKIKNKVTKKINSKNQKCSVVVLSDKESIIKWGNYIYKNFKKEKIGLERKYKKFSSISK